MKALVAALTASIVIFGIAASLLFNAWAGGSIDHFPHDQHPVVMPRKEEMYFSIEGLIHQFELVMTNRGWQPPIGEVYAATMLVYFDPLRPHVSSWYKYAGLHVEDGRAVKKKRGEKAAYNHHLKMHCLGRVGTSFVMVGGFYRAEYDRAKTAYQAKYPEAPKLHIHRMAVRLAVKLFLSHFHRKWREALGLETDPPYPQGMMGHGGYVPPPEKDE